MGGLIKTASIPSEKAQRIRSGEMVIEFIEKRVSQPTVASSGRRYGYCLRIRELLWTVAKCAFGSLSD